MWELRSCQRLRLMLSKSNSTTTVRLSFKHFTTFSRRYAKSKETELVKLLAAKIKATGPLTVADYMREVLTHPTAGYYMNKDVFGDKGDFTTSPEISQLFGEAVGIWCVHSWLNAGCPRPIQLVELGPGRGTLADDVLRVMSKFGELKSAVSLHLVEVSPKMRALQHERLAGSSVDTVVPVIAATDASGATGGTSSAAGATGACGATVCQSKYGAPVTWYTRLADVPRTFSIFIAHEFFDALPVHKIQKKDNAWREVVVYVDETEQAPHHFTMALAPNVSPTVSVLLPYCLAANEKREHVEVCAEAAVVMEELAERLSDDGGMALIADYGHTGDKSDTFRAFRRHEQVDPLCEPGTADLTADVDFAFLCRVAMSDSVSIHGPITQREFLHNMAIKPRLDLLLSKCSARERDDLLSGYDMITNPSKMGERFKFLSLGRRLPNSAEQIPAGFKPY